jgi:hypothetical protein
MGLVAHSSAPAGVLDAFRAGVHVTQTARGQAYSGMHAGLEIGDGGDAERDEQREAVEARGLDGEQHGSPAGGDGSEHSSSHEAPPAPARPDVLDTQLAFLARRIHCHHRPDASLATFAQ